MTRRGWRSVRLKDVATCNVEVLPETTADDYRFRYVDISAVTQGRIALPETDTSFGAAPSRARRLAVPGDTVISTVRTYLKAIAPVVISDDELVFSTGFAILHPTEVDPRFLSWLLQSEEFTARVEAASVGVSYPAINASDIMAMAVMIPDRAVQYAIADYLDRETAQIDTLIAKQEQLIATLRERRTSQISTTALDGFSPLNTSASSGPTLGTVFEVTLGKMLDAKKEPSATDTRLPYIRAANLQDEGLRLSDVNHMWYSPAEIARLNIKAKDLLVVEGGAVGTSVLVAEDMPGWSFQKTVNRIRARDDWSTAWLGYVLRAYRDEGIIDLICDGSTIAHLTAEKLRALRLPSISIAEQIQRATALDQVTAHIDTLIAKAERFIELSKERRAALITAAVTGQLDIPA